MVTNILSLIIFLIGMWSDDEDIFKKAVLFLLFVCALK